MQLEVHPSVIEKLSKMDCARARRFLKQFGFTRSEQDALMHKADCKKNPPQNPLASIFEPNETDT